MPEITLEAKINETLDLIKSHHLKADEQIKLLGTVSDETKSEITKLHQQLDAIDLKLVEQHARGAVNYKSVGDTIKENEDVSRLIRDRKGRAIINFTGEQYRDLMGQKTTLLEGGTGFGTAGPGVIAVERLPLIVQEARRRLRIRDLLTARPTTSPLIYYVKVSSPLTNAANQVEGSAKFENQLQFTTVSTNVQTIATFIKASTQIMDDVPELEGFLRTSLPYYVNRQEEQQLLSGDGTGVNLNGLVTQASAFNLSLLAAAAGYTRIDQIAAASEQIDILDEIPASFVVLNPRDWWNIRRTKDGFGRYILGDPQTVGTPTLWDLIPVPSNAMSAGSFLVGNSDPAAVEIRDRMQMQVAISTEDVDNFEKNLVTIRAEKRMALVVSRPQSFVSGTFVTSPAGF